MLLYLRYPKIESQFLGNIAYGMRTDQVGTFVHDRPWSSSLAVDGNIDPDAFNSHCAHTTHTTNPWWRVRFDDMYVIQGVRIYNRVARCCWEGRSILYCGGKFYQSHIFNFYTIAKHQSHITMSSNLIILYFKIRPFPPSYYK